MPILLFTLLFLSLSIACNADDDAIPGTDGAVVLDGARPDGSGIDAPATDSPATDSPATDSPATDAPTVDGDVGASCSPADPGGGCRGGLACLCCPIGGPAQSCLCTTACTTPADCVDPRPICNQPVPGASDGMCTPSGFVCLWEAV